MACLKRLLCSSACLIAPLACAQGCAGSTTTNGPKDGGPTRPAAVTAPDAGLTQSYGAACQVLPIDAGLPDGAALEATGANVFSDMTLNADAVYWTTGTEVMRAPLGSDDAVPVATAQNNSHALVVDSSSVYWTNMGVPPTYVGSVLSMQIDGGAISTLASDQDSPNAITIDQASVYFVVGGTSLGDGGNSPAAVLSVPRTGGTVTTVVSGLGSNWSPIAVYDGVLAFVSYLGNVGSQISTVPATGGTTTVLAPSEHRVGSIALDATSVYWVDSSGGGFDFTAPDGRIRSVPRAGGSATILADKQAVPGKLVLFGSTLFWSAAGTGGPAGFSGNGGLWSLPASGGTPNPIVANRWSVPTFGVDACHLAWFDLLDQSCSVHPTAQCSAADLFALVVMDR